VKINNVRTYKIIKCINCKRFVISFANSYFKCSYCQKNQDIRKKKIFFENENPLLIKEVLKKIKSEVENINVNKDIEKNNDDFISSDKLI
jgi:hypothetical protein